jgi:hypothetical protein
VCARYVYTDRTKKSGLFSFNRKNTIDNDEKSVEKELGETEMRQLRKEKATQDKINRRKERKNKNKLRKKNKNKNESKITKFHNKKQQEKNGGGGGGVADMDALKNAATAGALAAGVAHVSAINKSFSNDEDSFYSSICSLESESDVSDSDSDSDSDDSTSSSEDSSHNDENKGFLSKLMSPWSRNESKGISRSVSYVTDDGSAVYTDIEELEQYQEDMYQDYEGYGDEIYDPDNDNTIIGAMSNIGVMSDIGIGNVFGFGAEDVKDVRDLRIVGSDISNSSSSSSDSTLEDW